MFTARISQSSWPFATFDDTKGGACFSLGIYNVFRNAYITSSTGSFSWMCKGEMTDCLHARHRRAVKQREGILNFFISQLCAAIL